MDFYSKLFCFTATAIMLFVVVIVEKSNDNPNASPSPSMMIGWQPKANRINNEDPNGYRFRKIIERIDDEDEGSGSGSGDDTENDDNYSTDEYFVNPNAFGSRSTQNFMRNRQQALLIMLDLDTRCKRLIAEDERQCFRNYFLRYGKMDEVVFTNDPKSDFNRKACCSMWKWFDCTRVSIKRECDDIALRSFETNLKRSYVYTTYCVNYEYGSDACVPLTVWMIIGFATLAIMVLLGTCLSVALVVRYLHLKHEEGESHSGQSYDEPDEHEEFEL